MSEMMGTIALTGSIGNIATITTIAAIATIEAGLNQATSIREQGKELTIPCAVEMCGTLNIEGKGYELHGQVACSRECLETLLRGVVLEESMRATAAAITSRPRVLLGRILVEQGTISEAQLEEALRLQRDTGAGKLGSWLNQGMILPEAEFTAALAIQSHCPVFSLGNFVPARMASYLPKALMEEHGVVALRTTGYPQRLSLCFEDHLDHELMRVAERMNSISVEGGLLTESDFWQATRNLLAVQFPKCMTVQAPSVDCMVEAMSRLLASAGAVSVRLAAVHGSYWLRFWTLSNSVLASGEPGEMVPHDVLCTPGSISRAQADGSDVEELTAAMLRVLR